MTDYSIPATPISVSLASDDSGAENGLAFSVAAGDGGAGNITGATFWFRVFRSPYSADADALLTATNHSGGTGVVITDAAGGLARVDITTEAKAAVLERGMMYYYRLVMRETGGVDTPILRGSYEVVE